MCESVGVPYLREFPIRRPDVVCGGIGFNTKKSAGLFNGHPRLPGSNPPTKETAKLSALLPGRIVNLISASESLSPFLSRIFNLRMLVEVEDDCNRPETI